MKLLLCFCLLYAVTVDSSSCPGECCMSDVISLTNLMKSMASTILENSKIVCTDVMQRGALASCPTDYTPTGCSCGMGCGSWDIRTENSCHCQCANIDWTSARCCKMGSK
ncbi:resistin-like beta [Mantella aurantiaca]